MTGDALWHVRDAPLGDGRWQMSGYSGGPYADGELVVSPELGSPDVRLVWRTNSVAGGIVRVTVPASEFPELPALWYVLVDEPRAQPPATNLVAFATEDFEAGTVITAARFATAGVQNNDQVGAVRWYPLSGIVHQIFVSEGWRRRKAGSALLYAAGAVHLSLGGRHPLHSDGRRTDLGERFVATQKYSQRVAPLSETMPPLDPS